MIAALESEHKSFNKDKNNSRHKLQMFSEKLDQNNRYISKMMADYDTFLSRVIKDKEGNKLSPVRLDGLNATDTKTIGKRLQQIAKSVNTHGNFKTIGELYGFPILVKSEVVYQDGKDSFQNRFYIEGAYKYSYNYGYIAMADTNAATLNFLNALERIPTSIEQYRKENELLERDIPILQAAVNGSWKKEAELRNLKDEFTTLNLKIDMELKETTQTSMYSESEEPIDDQDKENLLQEATEPYSSYSSSDNSTIQFQSYNKPKIKNDILLDSHPLEGKTITDLQSGEFCKVERIFNESKAFDFTSAVVIESAKDVAYIFKNLEDSSIENSFAVLVKDQEPTVIHLAMGKYDGVLINGTALLAAVERVNPDSIYFVHNHPSGRLLESMQDKAMWKKLYGLFGDKLQPGIIINLKSGKFLTFDDESSIIRDTKRPENEQPVKLFSFSKLVFEPDYDPSMNFKVKNSSDAAAFISSHKLGGRKKISLIILDRMGGIVGNIFTPFTKIGSDNVDEVTKTIVKYITTMGGCQAIIYGDYEAKIALNILWKKVNDYSLQDFKLADAISVNRDNSHYISAADEGILFRSKQAKNSFELINEIFNNKLHQQVSGALNKNHLYELGRPGHTLLCAGIPDLPIQLRADKLAAKASEEYKSNHPFKLEDVSNLPEAINKPIAVFDSKTRMDAKVILTELKSNGHNFVVALQINRKVGHIEINSVRSIYPKDYVIDIFSWIKEGLLKWVDKNKAFDFISNSSTPANVDKKIKSLNSITNIVDTFQNPTLNQGEIIAEIENLSEQLNTPVHIIRDIDKIPDFNKDLRPEMRDSKGWYDPKTGNVYLLLSNTDSVADAQATVLHEVVAHKGLRFLLKEHFEETMENIFYSLPENKQTLLLDKYKNKIVAAEEYCANMAEDMPQVSILSMIHLAIKSALRRLRIDLKIKDNDIAFMLHKSKANLEKAKDSSTGLISHSSDEGNLYRFIGEKGAASQQPRNLTNKNNGNIAGTINNLNMEENIKTVDESRINWDELKSKFGITKEMLIEKGVYEGMLTFKKSNCLLNVNYEGVNGAKEFQARLAFRTKEDGITLQFYPIKEKPMLDVPFMGYTFTDDDKAVLLQTGHLGKTVEVQPYNHEKFNAYISIDPLTNDIIAVDQNKVRINDEIGKVKLKKEQKEEILSGRPVFISGMTNKNGEKFDAFVQIDANKKGVIFVNSTSEKEDINNMTSLKGVPIDDTLKERLKNGEKILIEGLQSRDNRSFSAEVSYNEETSRFKYDFPKQRNGEFIIPKTIKEVKLTKEQQNKLANGERVLLQGMVSKSGNKFDAFVCLDKQKGTIHMEFPVRDQFMGAIFTPEQKEKLQNGDPVWMELEKKSGEKFKVPLLWNSQKGLFEFEQRKEQQEIGKNLENRQQKGLKP